MSFTNLLAQISGGGVLVITGSVIVGAGVALGLNAAIPDLPLWLCLTLLGITVGGVGVGLVGHGTEKTEDKVEKNLSVGYQITQNPLATMAIALVGGLVVYRLLFSSGSSSSENKSSPEKTPTKETEEASRKEDKSIFSSVGDSLAKMGSMAGTAAMGLGLQSIGLPTLQQLEEMFREVTGANTEERKDTSRKKGSSKSKDNSRAHNGYQQQQA